MKEELIKLKKQLSTARLRSRLLAREIEEKIKELDKICRREGELEDKLKEFIRNL